MYEALGEEDAELMANRPLFTGDVFRLDDGSKACLVQHPCAMRQGTQLVERVLACGLSPSPIQIRTDWASGDFKRAYLPTLEDGKNYGIQFTDLLVLNRDELLSSQRIAVLSEIGVNLLVQRWIYHNSRVVVPTITIHRQVAPQHEEADLTMEAVDHLVMEGWPSDTALTRVDQWLDDPTQVGGRLRSQLLDPQARSTVRKRMRTLLSSAGPYTMT
ncbi:hypothetical protein [Promicromonospora iranensis]|uniref:Uncharacterized protein n=1 Tax=Promicromonospora iranensis TaxID=1105144 RepID=A0ABU2CQQ0_9MICO|nr:hypothetical protein [Promicromonospora iranensis]MDR7383596.1 hypothetical protein [Promicromonospora iranensis]